MSFRTGFHRLGSAALVVQACLWTTPSPAQTIRWAELPPPPLTEGTTVFDSARQRHLIVAAAVDPSVTVPVVWSLTLGTTPEWTEIPTQGTVFRLPRDAVIYDPVRDRLVVVPGNGFVATLRFDVHPPLWQTVSTPGPVPQGVEYSAIYDPMRDRMIVFGGRSGSLFLNDVRALDLSTMTWTSISPTGTPPQGRGRQTVVYDPTGDRMIVFGGWRFSTTVFNESWALSLAGTPAWTFLTPSGSVPTARHAHTAVLDAAGQRMVVHGGNSGSALLNDTWAMSLTAGNVATWTQLPSHSVARQSHHAMYDPAGPRMLMQGGSDATGYPRTDLWTLNLTGPPAWALAPGTFATSPPAMARHAAIVDVPRSRVVLFGSDPNTWVRSLTTNAGWSIMGSLPLPRSGAAAAADEVSDHAFRFGGFYSISHQNDTHRLALDTGAWHGVNANPRPPVREHPMAAYDPTRRQMLIYGGEYFDGTRYRQRDDTWSWDAASEEWMQLSVGSFGQRGHMSGIYDPVRDRIVAFGGTDTSLSYVDVHVLPLGPGGIWSTLATQGTPPHITAAYGTGAIYDPIADRVLFTVAMPGQGTISAMEVWALTLTAPPTWAKLTPIGRAPPSTRFHSLVPDYPRGRAVLYGGVADLPLVNQTWALIFDPVVGVTPDAMESKFRLAIAPNPGIGPLRASFSLESIAPATLELLDVQGRRVATRELRFAAPGPQSVVLDEARALRSGLYFVRLTQGPRRAYVKATIMN